MEKNKSAYFTIFGGKLNKYLEQGLALNTHLFLPCSFLPNKYLSVFQKKVLLIHPRARGTKQFPSTE